MCDERVLQSCIECEYYGPTNCPGRTAEWQDCPKEFAEKIKFERELEREVKSMRIILGTCYG